MILTDFTQTKRHILIGICQAFMYHNRCTKKTKVNHFKTFHYWNYWSKATAHRVEDQITSASPTGITAFFRTFWQLPAISVNTLDWLTQNWLADLSTTQSTDVSSLIHRSELASQTLKQQVNTICMLVIFTCLINSWSYCSALADSVRGPQISCVHTVCVFESYLLLLLALASEASVALEAEPAAGAACKTHSPSAPPSASGGASYSLHSSWSQSPAWPLGSQCYGHGHKKYTHKSTLGT